MSQRRTVLPSALVAFAWILAAVDGQAATINAASCASTAVQTAVNSAANGDTVVVPAGNCTWTAAVNVPNGKNLTISGAGIDVTTIGRSALGDVFTLNDTATRITGFTFNQGRIRIGGNESGASGSNGWRIDHNRFTGPASGAPGYTFIDIACSLDSANPGRHCSGLIDNNQFVNGQVGPFGFKATSDLHRTWANTTSLGDGNTVFIEDNAFSDTSGNLTQPVDTNYGGRFVFRFNTVDTMAAHVHSLQGYRGSRAWEIYKNSGTGSGWTSGFFRGGVGVHFGNTFTNSLGDIVLDNVRSYNTGYHYGVCDGTSTADGNSSGGQGWPCRDQIGRGRDQCVSNPSSTTGSASGWCAQAAEPSYFFLNRHANNSIVAIDTAGRGRSTTHHVLPNRDFYNEVSGFNGTSGVGSGPLANRPATCTVGVAYWATDQGEWNSRSAGADGQLYTCTATNTWTFFYRPYQYPHPLQGSAPPPPTTPAPPTNVRIVP